LSNRASHRGQRSEHPAELEDRRRYRLRRVVDWGVVSTKRRPAEGCPVIGASDRKVPRSDKKKKKMNKNTKATNLETGAGRVALLLLGTIVGRRLAARALSSRRFALAASHCCFVCGCAGWVQGRGREKKSSRSIGAKSWAGTFDENDTKMGDSGGVVGNIDVGYGMRCRCGGGWW